MEAEPGRDLPGALLCLRLDQNPAHTLPSTLGSFRLGLTVWKLFYYVYLLYFSLSRFPESKDIDSCSKLAPQCLEWAGLLITSMDTHLQLPLRR